VLPSWSNAAAIWTRSENDYEAFWKYVGREECYTKLSQKNSRGIEWKEDEGWARTFAESKDLSDDAVIALLSGMNKGVIETYDGKNATQDRIQRLVRVGRIQYSTKLFRQLKTIDNDSHITFAALFVKEFCASFEDDLVDSSDVMKLLKSECLNRRNVPLLVNTLRRFITTNDSIASAAARLSNIGNFRDVCEEVLDAILPFLASDSLQCMVIQHLGGGADDIRRRLGKMKEPYSKLGDKGCRPLIPRWNGLEEFLEFLKNKGVVSSFVLADDGKMQVNTTRS
jgi:hypothetical protein